MQAGTHLCAKMTHFGGGTNVLYGTFVTFLGWCKKLAQAQCNPSSAEIVPSHNLSIGEGTLAEINGKRGIPEATYSAAFLPKKSLEIGQETPEENHVRYFFEQMLTACRFEAIWQSSFPE